ncbi:hypothetical protein [Lacihabitans soyangensis]|uniref:Uncharacterized protein n=1 Tax=Lacihabitans soyangensis TaxID=869394 RepID=A0AAE3H2X1_9BACT|nr:hypothetical protein [Lacihabitans soyangensis]MCP9763918.1 hypothetical protein [Lacihabitans soyangensis]
MKWRVDGMRRQAWRLCMVVMMFVAMHGVCTGQSVVKDLENVKKPAFGKLYFSRKDSGVYVWKGKWSKVLQETGFGSAQPPVQPPPTPIAPQPPVGEQGPVLQEIPLGFWELPDRLLVAKLLDGKYHLMQTDRNRSYYVPRGKNLLLDSRTKVNSDALRQAQGDNGDGLATGNSDVGGLASPSTFKDGLMTAKGYVKNAQGEWVLRQAQDPIVVVPPAPQPPVGEPVADKIKIPVGAIMWDGWHYDYWNDVNPKYDILINHVSKSRLVATEYMDQFRVLPFYGQYHAPEKIKIRYNVKWNQELGRNTYDEMEREVQVKYDKTQADCDREIQYYAEAGFDFFCFNYYNSDSPLSEARLQFVNSTNKRGIKMTFMLASKRNDTEINYITDLMLKDCWFKIDNKPVLYFNNKDMEDLPKYKSAYAAKGGGEIYVVYYSMGGTPGDFGEYMKFGAQAGGSYTLFVGQKTAEEFMKAEVESRDNWMRQYKHTHLNIIPTLSTGFENLHNRSSLDLNKAVTVGKASLAQIEEKLVLMKKFIVEYPNKVPAVLWYAGNEILESGNPIVPTKRKDGSIDTSMLDTIKRHLE